MRYQDSDIKQSPLVKRQLEAQAAMMAAFGGFFHLLATHDGEKEFRFLRIARDEERAWRATLGTLDFNEEPLVSYSQGADWLDTLAGLAKAYSEGRTYPDRYAKTYKKG